MFWAIFWPVLGAVIVLALLIKVLRWSWKNERSMGHEAKELISKLERILNGEKPE